MDMTSYLQLAQDLYTAKGYSELKLTAVHIVTASSALTLYSREPTGT